MAFGRICGLFILLATCPALAADYYVARLAPGASDEHDGLSAAYAGGSTGPWKSLAQAAKTAGAGDTVHIFSGDYREDDMGWGIGLIALQKSGTQAKPLRFVAAAGENPIVFAFRLIEAEWVEITGLTFVNPGLTLPNHWTDMPSTVVDDPTVVIDPDEPWSSREAKVRRKYATFMGIIDDFETNYPTGIDVDGASNILISNNSFSFYSFGVQLRNTATDITVEDNSFAYCRNGIFTWRDVPSTIGSILRNNTFSQSFASSIDVREGAERVLIDGNKSDFAGIHHIALHSGTRDTTVSGNMVRHGGFYTETMEHPGSSAINIHSVGPGNIVEGNFAAYQIDPTLLDGNGYIADVIFGERFTIRNNLAYRNMGSGITLVHSPNGTIVNNTIVENGFRTPSMRNGAGLRIVREDDINNIVVNNIFSRNQVSGIYTVHPLQSQLMIDYNFYHQPDTPLIWEGWGKSDHHYMSLDEVRSGKEHWEQNGLAGDPDFLDPAGLNFRLGPGSPAVDACLSDSFIPITDFDGVNRMDIPDCGAFEAVQP